jgi:hypothetical protein
LFLRKITPRYSLAQRREHSRKPEEFCTIAESTCQKTTWNCFVVNPEKPGARLETTSPGSTVGFGAENMNVYNIDYILSSANYRSNAKLYWPFGIQGDARNIYRFNYTQTAVPAISPEPFENASLSPLPHIISVCC